MRADTVVFKGSLALSSTDIVVFTTISGCVDAGSIDFITIA